MHELTLTSEEYHALYALVVNHAMYGKKEDREALTSVWRKLETKEGEGFDE